MKLYNGDCLEVMQELPDGSIDMVLTDPPYGTTACAWDSVIDFSKLWAQLERVIKPTGAALKATEKIFIPKHQVEMYRAWETSEGGSLFDFMELCG